MENSPPSQSELTDAALTQLRAEARARDDKARTAWVDKMMTLSTGLLALLVTFQEKFETQNCWLSAALVLCWIFLALAAICSAYAGGGECIVGLLREQKATDEVQRTQARIEQLENFDAEHIALRRTLHRIGYDRSKDVIWATVIAMLSLIAAFVLFVGFAAGAHLLH